MHFTRIDDEVGGNTDPMFCRRNTKNTGWLGEISWYLSHCRLFTRFLTCVVPPKVPYKPMMSLVCTCIHHPTRNRRTPNSATRVSSEKGKEHKLFQIRSLDIRTRSLSQPRDLYPCDTYPTLMLHPPILTGKFESNFVTL